MPAPCAFTRDLFDRTPVVNVDDVWLNALGDFDGCAHYLNIVSKNLDADGFSASKMSSLGNTLSSVADECLGGDEFGIHEVRAVFFADCAKGRIADIFHRASKSGNSGCGGYRLLT